MRNHLKYTIPIALVMGCMPARAQWYNDTAVVNPGGLISNWNSQAWNTTNGNYSAAGSAGAPGNYGVFEHYGQTGTGNSSALRNDGIYNAVTNGRDYFKGPNNTAGQQGIGGTTAPIFGELFLENGTGQLFDITNANGIEIAGNISFSNGITTTVRSSSSTGSLKLRDDATYTNTASGDAQYVNGYVTKTGNDPFVFPVGAQNGTDIRTLQITAPASTADALSIAYWAGSAAATAGLDPTITGTQSLTTLNPAGTAGVDQLFSVSPLCFWDWIPVNGTSSLYITVSLPATVVNGGYATAAEMRLAGWNTTTLQWDNLSGSTGSSGTAEGSTLSGTVTNMSNYSAIAIASISGIPLPIHITTFSGYLDKQCVAHLSWTTGQESYIRKFTIQYSEDGKAYTDATEVACLNQASGSSYNMLISDVPMGDAIFRLKATGLDGNEAYHNKVLHFISNCTMHPIEVWPNPANDNLMISGLDKNSIIYLSDIAGRQLIKVSSGDDMTTQLSLGQFKAGIYMLSIRVDNMEVMRQKVVKQ